MRREDDARLSDFPSGDVHFAASNALAGRLEPAQKAMARALERNPGLRTSNLRGLTPFRRAEDFATFAEGPAKQGFRRDCEFAAHH